MNDSITQGRWLAVDRWLDRALELPDAERSQWLRRNCPDDAVRFEVAEILAADRAVRTDFLQSTGGTTPFRPEDWTGRLVGPYRLAGLIGRGSSGAVFLARRSDREFERDVAIKILLDDRPELRLRLRAERQILAQLVHPWIARLYDGGTIQEGLPYLVMEHVDGEPIDRYCNRRKLAIAPRLRLFAKVCEAVHHAHQNLLVHRDLKPSNVLVTPEGIPKLIDFGIAKPIGPGATRAGMLETRTGWTPMTPAYASPEQVRGQILTTGSDVFSLGVLLYRLLTDRSPYPGVGSDWSSLVEGICHHEPPLPSRRLRDLNPEEAPPVAAARSTTPTDLARRVAGDLDNITLEAMRKEAGRRYPSALALAEDLGRHLDQLPVLARPATLSYRAGKFLRRNRAAVAVASALAVLAVVFVVSLVLLNGRLDRQQRLAEAGRQEAQEMRLRSDQALRAMVDFLYAPPQQSTALGDDLAEGELGRTAAAAVGERPRLRAALLESVAQIYTGMGHYDRARPLVDHAVGLRREALPDGAPELARGLAELAEVLHFEGRLEEAERVYLEALAHIEGRDPIATARILSTLGSLYRERGELAAARRHHRRATEIFAQAFAPPHPELARTAMLEGLLAREAGDWSAAEERLATALEMRIELFGGEHPLVAEAQSNLASLANDRGRFRDAVALLQPAAARAEATLFNEYPLVNVILNNLAYALHGLGDHATAERTYRYALANSLPRLGRSHPLVATLKVNLAALLRDTDRNEEALALALQATEIRESAFGGASSPRFAEALALVADLRFAAGERAAAEADYRRALPAAGWRRAPVADPRLGLAGLLLDRGESAEAVRLVRSVVDERRRWLAPGDWRLGTAEAELATALAAAGERSAASAMAGDAEGRLAALPATDPRRRRADTLIASVRRDNAGLLARLESLHLGERQP
ncbi:MAG: serine/threonine-protein kinase [Acidobacteriota bacterium]